MKRIFKIFTLISLVAMLSCETRRDDDRNDDSNEVAEEANDEKFEDNDMENDADFVAESVARNYAEIKFAQLAAQKSANPQVKELARQLEKDHNKLLSDLKALAQKKAITVPTEAEDADQRKIERFYDESGKDFDKKWAKEMMDMHEKSVNRFERRFEKTEDADLKTAIDKSLPVIRRHHEKLNALHEQIKDRDV